MNFKKANNITGWVVCVIASLVYILTAEKAGSFWDCGEFVSAAFKVQMPHPPGAPLFVLLGRFFIVLFGDNPNTAAKAVNIMNALASGFTILFLFWTITHYARKLTSGFLAEPDKAQIFTIMGAGVVGALAYTFTDSFWFSAVEGEVYAFSSFFTALAFWAMLKWERADVEAGNNPVLKARADRWIVFLFFSLGLSIGVHLLGLLTIPAIVMIYYFRRYNYTRWGAIWAFVIGCIITGLVQVVVIQYSVKIAGQFDIFFVNSFGLPFFFGFAFFFILLGVVLWWGLRFAKRKNLPLMTLGIWSFIFIMLGYSSYVTPLERSNANTAIDMNNVDNPMNLVYYLGRDQYGSQPIVTGPHFLARAQEGDKKYLYAKSKDPETKKDTYLKYENPQPEIVYDNEDVQFFPRLWEGNDPNRASFYIQWLNLPVSGVTVKSPSYLNDVSRDAISLVDKTTRQQSVYPIPEGYAVYNPWLKSEYSAGEQIPVVKIPTMANNIEWFFTYQMGFMYWRYFMWNFSGRQNDVQGFGNVRDGNWTSGISFIDNMRLGDQSKMPESLQTNKAHNSLFLLPFLLGILGCIYQFIKDRKDWIATFLLFFFTGIAIVIYLNQPGTQPRERDYAFAGSFYAYAIWIGLAVVAFVRMAREAADKLTLRNVLIYGSLSTFLIMVLSDANSFNTGKLGAALIGAILFAALTLGVTFLLRSLRNASLQTIALASSAICLLTPVIMGAKEWDDHDRSQKLLAPDIAKDYLNSCPKNAVLFTYGDNDTYPLWYAQEVEGIRPDIRIINTSLLGIDWYVNQLRYKINESDPINVIWTEDQIRGVGYVRVNRQDVRDNQSLLSIMTEISKKGPQVVSLPYMKNVTVPVDSAMARQDGILEAGAPALPQITLDLSGIGAYSLDQIAMLNIIAANAWKRPICVTSPDRDKASFLFPYLQRRGMIYQLSPAGNLQKSPEGLGINADTTYQLLETVFRSGNAGTGKVYFDEENRRHLNSLRDLYSIESLTLSSEGRKQEALNVVEKADSLLNPKSLPYGMPGRGHNQITMDFLRAAYAAGDMALAQKVKVALRKDLNEQLQYYAALKEFKDDYYMQLSNEEKGAQDLLKEIGDLEAQFESKKAPLQELPQKKDTADTSRK